MTPSPRVVNADGVQGRATDMVNSPSHILSACSPRAAASLKKFSRQRLKTYIAVPVEPHSELDEL